MIFIINELVKQKFNKIEFNCDFVMFIKIIFLLQSIGDVEFMKFTKKYYTLKYEFFDSMFDYFIYIKLLKKRMRITKIKLNDDKQTLLCLTMFLLENFQYFIKIWVITKNFIVEIIRNILLKENRRSKSDVFINFYNYVVIQQQQQLKL